MIARAALALLLAVALVGCGSSSLSSKQLRSDATRTCTRAGRRLERIPTPKDPSQGASFLRRGIAAIEPELTAMARMRPPNEAARQYGRAQTAARKELAALRSALNGLEAGNDPAVAMKTLQEKLAPVERRASEAWRALGVPACALT